MSSTPTRKGKPMIASEALKKHWYQDCTDPRSSCPLCTTEPSEVTNNRVVVQCDNCAAMWDENLIVPLTECEGLNERLDPGSEVPYGDCPDCGSFCYLWTPRSLSAAKAPTQQEDAL